MNWKTAICILRNGGKITRPNWEAEHFWVLSKDGYERILCHDGTNASVHIKQTEANDWGSWREPTTREMIEEKFQEFNYKNGIYPNIMFVGDLGKNFVDNGMKLYGMEIITDDSLAFGEFKICYAKPRKRLSEILYRISEIGYNAESYEYGYQGMQEEIKKIKEELC